MRYNTVALLKLNERILVNKSLIKSIFETILNKFIAVFLGLLVTAVLAQNLNKVEFGRYTFVLALVSLAGVPILLGIQRLLVRETAQSRQFWDYRNVIAVHKLAALTAVLYSILFFIFCKKAS